MFLIFLGVLIKLGALSLLPTPRGEWLRPQPSQQQARATADEHGRPLKKGSPQLSTHPGATSYLIGEISCLNH